MKSLGPCVLLAALLWGCGTTGSYYQPAPPDAGVGSAKSQGCATDYGNALSDTFGRLDGTISAVVEPSDTQCKSATADAVVVEVTVAGAVYKVTIDATNPKSTTNNTDYFYVNLPHAALDAWSEGWHVGGQLDYAGQLGVHTDANTAWTDEAEANLIKKLDDDIPVGKKVSVYGTNAGGDETTVHLIHYLGSNNDGALLIDPGGANTWLLLHGDGVIF